MNIPETSIHYLIDGLPRSGRSFALYRLPWTDEPILVLQKEGMPDTVGTLAELNGKEGFVMAPFRVSETHPIVIIRPDKVARNWDEITETLAGECSPTDLPASGQADSAPTGNRPDEDIQRQKYTEAFNLFIEPLRKKTFRKLVLSRQSHQPLPEKFSPLNAFVKACNSYPRMMISLCHTPESGTWIGSTPEIILSGSGTEWHTVSLAGTMPMDGENMPTEWSEKNREEQAFVSEYIRKTVRKFGSKVTEKGPYTARAGQLVHLKTDFHFTLKETGHLGDILQELHPTPAVCGLPKDDTYRFIQETEGYDRSYYSGIIGWLDPEEETTLYVNLRCMQIGSDTATLYAGGGILPTSEAVSEWEETQQKMNTMRNIL